MLYLDHKQSNYTYYIDYRNNTYEIIYNLIQA